MMTTRPVIPRSASTKAMERRKDHSIASVVNSLMRLETIVRSLTQSGRDKWKIKLVDSDIPDTITRDTELAAAIAALKFPIPLFDHYADASTSHTDGTEDTLYTDTLAAGRLASNGDKLSVLYAGFCVGHATATRRVRGYFGGTAVLDTGNILFSVSSAWELRIELVRVSASVVRVSSVLSAEGAPLAVYTTYFEVTGLTLANTQIVKLTGVATGAGAAAADIVATQGRIIWTPAA